MDTRIVGIYCKFCKRYDIRNEKMREKEEVDSGGKYKLKWAIRDKEGNVIEEGEDE